MKLCSEGRFKNVRVHTDYTHIVENQNNFNSLKSNLPVLHVLYSGSRFVALPAALCHQSPRTRRAGLTLRAVTRKELQPLVTDGYLTSSSLFFFTSPSLYTNCRGKWSGPVPQQNLCLSFEQSWAEMVTTLASPSTANVYAN